MKYLPHRIWFLVVITSVIWAAIIRLAWEITIAPSAGSLAVISFAIFGLLGIYALFVYFTVKPSLKKLKSRPVGIGVAVMATVGVISGIIHFIRFVPSSEAAEPLSVVIAALLLLAGISAYFLLLWVIWSIWKAKES